MPKVLLFYTLKNIWIFLFYPNDSHENRSHVHVGKSGVDNFCKIWLDPKIEIAKKGDLTQKQIDEVIKIAEEYKVELLEQWSNYKDGKEIKPIIAKTNKKKK